jgi:hypothetical protein
MTKDIPIPEGWTAVRNVPGEVISYERCYPRGCAYVVRSDSGKRRMIRCRSERRRDS